jgi:uncharacterized protein YceK
MQLNLKLNYRYYKVSIVTLLTTVLLSGCYTYRVETKAQPGSEMQGITANSFLWGLIQSPKRIVNPV